MEELCLKFAEIVAKDFKPDLIIFIAKGGFIIGTVFSQYFAVPLMKVECEREGSRIKKMVAPIFMTLPRVFRFWLIEMEMRMGVHNTLKKRKVKIPDYLERLEKEDYKNIMIVDDSVDTGHTAGCVKQAIEMLFPKSKIKFASISVIRYSLSAFQTDFYLFKDTIIQTGTSKDSKEYKKFIGKYREWEKNEGFSSF